MAARPPILIPAETRNREFDAKLLLACVAAERGFPAIVGSRIHMHRAVLALPRGIYIAKDARRPSLRIYRILKQLGHAIVAWDEEGLIFITPALYHRRRIDAETLGLIELYLAWGAKSAELIRAAPGYGGFPIVETGNPRIDLLRPELAGFGADEAAALRARFGDFILVNTNFGRVNHFDPALSLEPYAEGEAARRNLEPDDPPIEAWRFRARIMAAMVALVPALARAFPDWRVVLRPHPAENHEAWRTAGAGHANVTVIHEGAIAPWLLAARAVVHNGCTTGIEGRLAGAPVIAFRPEVSADWDIALPNEVGVTATDADAAIAAIRRLASLPRPVPLDEAERARLGGYLAALDGPLASDRIVDALGAFAARRPLGAPATGDRLVATADALVRAASKRLNSLRAGHKDSAGYTEQRFPPITLAEVAARVARFAALTGRFGGVEAGSIAPNVFRLRRR